MLAVAPAYWVVIVAAIPIGICSGVFLGVDWALMTDIIPKAESGPIHGHQQHRRRGRRARSDRRSAG